MQVLVTVTIQDDDGTIVGEGSGSTESTLAEVWYGCADAFEQARTPAVADARAAHGRSPLADPEMCPRHPAFEADNCPGCGTSQRLHP